MVISHAAKSGKEDPMDHDCQRNFRLSNAPTHCRACERAETLYEVLTGLGLVASLAVLTFLADLLRG